MQQRNKPKKMMDWLDSSDGEDSFNNQVKLEDSLFVKSNDLNNSNEKQNHHRNNLYVNLCSQRFKQQSQNINSKDKKNKINNNNNIKQEIKENNIVVKKLRQQTCNQSSSRIDKPILQENKKNNYQIQYKLISLQNGKIQQQSQKNNEPLLVYESKHKKEAALIDEIQHMRIINSNLSQNLSDVIAQKDELQNRLDIRNQKLQQIQQQLKNRKSELKQIHIRSRNLEQQNQKMKNRSEYKHNSKQLIQNIKKYIKSKVKQLAKQLQGCSISTKVETQIENFIQLLMLMDQNVLKNEYQSLQDRIKPPANFRSNKFLSTAQPKVISYLSSYQNLQKSVQKLRKIQKSRNKMPGMQKLTQYKTQFSEDSHLDNSSVLVERSSLMDKSDLSGQQGRSKSRHRHRIFQ